MSLMKHLRHALRDKSPQEKIEGQLRREHGVVDGRGGKHLQWHPEENKVHVLTSKKPMLASLTARKRKHSDGLWHHSTFHWNGNHKITHKQDWQDSDHWHGQPPYRRIDVHQENDNLDHRTESVIQMPGTHRWEVGDTVEHEGQRHTIYTIPSLTDGRHPKSIAVIHPEGNKRDLTNYKRVYLRDLKKV